MAKRITTRKGKTIVLLNPKEKSEKFVKELASNHRLTNDLKVKCDKDGVPLELSKEARAYRTGYRASFIDSAKCYYAKKKRRQANTQQKRGKKN